MTTPRSVLNELDRSINRLNWYVSIQAVICLMVLFAAGMAFAV